MPYNISQIVQQIKTFKNLFRGDPNQQLQSMINSGQIPQDALNKAQEMARPIYEAMKDLAR